MAINASARNGRTPDIPIASVRARRSMVARTTAVSTGGPPPPACDRALARRGTFPSNGGREAGAPSPASGEGNVFEGFAPAQTTQLGVMGAHVARHLLRVGPRVLPQRPPDRLADEEVAIGQVRLD